MWSIGWPGRAIRAWAGRCRCGRLVLLGALVAARPLTAQADLPVVRQLSFEGNTAFTDDSLRTMLITTRSSFFARAPLRFLGFGEERTFSQRDFLRDIQGLALFYRASGYLDVKIDTLVRHEKQDVYVTFKITEGTPVRVHALRVTGLDSVHNGWRVRQDLPLEAGDVFSRFRLRADSDTVATRLANRGYPSARVTMIYPTEPIRDPIDIELRVETGAPAVFGRVRVEGQVAVDSAFIASLLPAQLGNSFRRDELYRSQRALYATDLFRFATVEIDSSRFHTGDQVVPLLVRVIEGSSHRATATAGYGTDDCFRLGAGWTARNFLGGGKVLDLSGRLSKIGVGSPLGFGAERSICSRLTQDSVGSRQANYGLTATVRRNAFLSADNTLETSVFAERRSEFQVYERQEFGASVSLTHETAARVPVTVAFRTSYGATEANSASFCAFLNTCLASDIARLRERRVLSTLALSATRARVNNVLDPTRGSILAIEATLSSHYLGSSHLSQFFRVVGDASAYVPLTRQVVLAGHLRGGIILAPKLDLASGEVNFVPPEQRFYAGGPNDVRGYNRNELGPVIYVISSDSVNSNPAPGEAVFHESAVRVSPIGGSRIGIANLELRLPSPIFSERVRFAAFVDAGSLWSAGGTSTIRVTPGAGIRFSSPLGPVRFDLGYNKYALQSGSLFEVTRAGDLVLLQSAFVKARSSKWTWNFSVGHAF